MSVWSADARGRLGEAALWAGAALVVATIHAGAVAWYLRQPPAPPGPAPATAIAVELAMLPMPEAGEEIDLAPDEAMMEAPDAPMVDDPVEEQEEIAEPEPEPAEEADEEPQEIEEPPDEPDEIEEPEASEAIIPLPRRRPPNVAPAAPPAPQPQPATPAPRSAAPPRAEAEPVEPTAAPEAAPAEPTEQVSPARWQQRLLAHLERHKRYPSRARSRREQGTAVLRFTIDSRGNVTRAAIETSAGHSELDQAVLDMIRRASPVPAPPQGVSHNLTVPVRFSLR